MKHLCKRVVSFCLAATITAGALPFAVAAQDDLRQYSETHTVSTGLTLTSGKYNSDAGAAGQTYVLDYKPNEKTRPMVVYGSKIYGKSTINEAISYAQKQGETVMAAINADFFDMATGVPTGMVVREGRLCVSDGAWNAVGFFADGTAICGAPKLSMYLTAEDGTRIPVYGLNKTRTAKGAYLYTNDFSSTTRVSTPGTDVVLTVPAGETLRLGVPMNLTVSAVSKGAWGVSLDETRMVLSLDDTYAGSVNLAALTAGQTLTLTCETADKRWHDVVYASGGGDMLLRDGSYTSSATSATAPRTALGVRPDGSFAMIVADGRQKGIADGASLKSVAERLKNMGCTNVVNLDGGGSSVISSRENGEQRVPVISMPSDGNPRKCANFIMFVNKGNPNQPQSAVTVFPREQTVLAGANVTLSAAMHNDDYFPFGSFGGALAIQSGDGTLNGNVLTAGAKGQILVGADTTMAVTPAKITVTDAPARVSLVTAGSSTALTDLFMEIGAKTDLNVVCSDGLRPILSQDRLFTFTATGGIGTIDADGVFTAASLPGMKGAITATYAGVSVSIPVTVGHAPELLDGFETQRNYVTQVNGLAGATATAEITKAGEAARYGFGSLRFTYQAPAPAAGESGTRIECTAASYYPVASGALAVTLFAQGSGSYALEFTDAAGNVLREGFRLSGTGWQFVRLPVPKGAVKLRGFSANTADQASGTLIVDQMMVQFTSADPDMVPPVVSLTVEDSVATALVTDAYPLPLTRDMITLSVDGASYPFEFDAELGVVTAVLPLDGGKHRVTVSVRDSFYNTARASAAVGEAQTNVFADLTGHWSRDYAEFLCAKGVFAVDKKFMPQRNTTNEMAATLISRYLGADTKKYDAVELPYSDAKQIAGWALPHVRALYALGVMKGSSYNGISVFKPQSEASRAQIMTIMGRTLPRGAAYSTPPFEDWASVPAWAREHITELWGAGVVSGYGGKNLVAPLNPITRGEFAALLFKLY